MTILHPLCLKSSRPCLYVFHEFLVVAGFCIVFSSAAKFRRVFQSVCRICMRSSVFGSIFMPNFKPDLRQGASFLVFPFRQFRYRSAFALLHAQLCDNTLTG